MLTVIRTPVIIPIPEGKAPVRRRQRETFQCPEPEGHFPDPDRCNVYYRWRTGCHSVVDGGLVIVTDLLVLGVYMVELPG